MSSDAYILIACYQKEIKKARNDERKLIHCIRKLFELPVTVEHLQKTGVGKTVNSLRKHNGEVGSAAKALVAKWKAMVAAEEIIEKQDRPEPLADDSIRNSKLRNSDAIREEIKSEPQLIENTRNNNNNNNTNTSQRDKKRNNDSNEKHNSHSKEREKKEKVKLKHSEEPKTKSKSTHSHRSREEDKKSSTDSHRKHRKTTTTNESINSNASTDNDVLSKDAPKAKKVKLLLNDGIDNSMGASFSEALGMCSVSANKKLKKGQKPPIDMKTIGFVRDLEKSITSELEMNSLNMPSQFKPDTALRTPVVPSVPKITDNYKPAPINPNIMNCIYPSTNNDKVMLTNGDALSIGISSKTMRTKVYSGIKTGAVFSVPSLFDICIRILQKNIDALEYTGGVPFDVLRQVLERTTPSQLLTIEDYNPYLLEDTDILWQQHVGRHFRGKTKPTEETWREMFLRCEDEKERRLDILTKNIKISQKQSALPIKKTRLAYVDNVVKPPRNVLRKQEQYGTNNKPIASPAARVLALSSASHNTAKVGDPRLKVNRDVLQSTVNNPIRPKKAPLMAKTLQFIKKRYKR